MSGLYSTIDHSSLLKFLFYPRLQHSKPPHGAFDLQIPVDDNVSIVCRAYQGNENNPWILYFHGNGEVVSDYDGIAPLYTDRGLNLLVADYRGYGKSDGSPTFTDLVKDAGTILDYAYENVTKSNAYHDWFVMGRSLGSISALELAAGKSDRLIGMIVESGFISVTGLIRHLGLPSPGDLTELENEKRRLASTVQLPTLVIHGENDRLVPLTQGRELYETLGSEQKEFVTIPRADHNDVMFVDSGKYIQAIAGFVQGNIF
ncbi:MAG: alpha/beta hydrolase [Bacillota bacterium]